MRQTNDATTAAKELFAERLKDKLTEYDIKQNALAEDLGVSESTVGKWILGKSMPRTMGMIEKIAARLHVGKSYFLEAEPPAPPAASEKPHKKGVLIPVLGVVRAGVPIHAEEDIIDYEEIPQEMARSGEYFGLRIRGDSMLPTLHDGDTIIVRKQSDVDNGDIAIVLVNGDDATVKEIHEEPDGVTLIGHNVAVYAPHFYSNRQIQELPVQIIGKVVELRRKF